MLIVCVLLTILAFLVGICTWTEHDMISIVSMLGAVLFGVMDFILIIWIIIIYSNGFAIKDKIEMYQEENKVIEGKSSELVTKQMNVYIENNNKIKQLKEQNIDMKLGKWLLYFGK